MHLGLIGDNELENAELFGIIEEAENIIAHQAQEILEKDPALKVHTCNTHTHTKKIRETIVFISPWFH